VRLSIIMRNWILAFIALAVVSVVCVRALGADSVPPKKKTMADFFSEINRIQQEAYAKVDKDSKDPEFARKELLSIYADLVFRSDVESAKGLFATKNDIPLDRVPFLDAAEKRHVEDMKIKVLGILAVLPPSKPQGERVK